MTLEQWRFWTRWWQFLEICSCCVVAFRPVVPPFPRCSPQSSSKPLMVLQSEKIQSNGEEPRQKLVTKTIRTAYLRIHGRNVPYVELFSEQKLRELWEDMPFDVASSAVDTFIGNESRGGNEPVLDPVWTDAEDHLSGCEYMFAPLYKRNYQFQFPDNDGKVTNDSLRNFCLRVAYRGDAFCGWQTQTRNHEQPSVQKTLENYLDPLFSSKSDKTGKRSSNLPVAGRTDAGVHAIGQICRFRTHREDLSAECIHQRVSKAIFEGPFAQYVRVTHVVEVSRAFHPRFTTSRRAYVYLIDAQTTGFWSLREDLATKTTYMNHLLHKLEGKTLDYFGLSYGRPQTQHFMCCLYHARARLVIHSKHSRETAITDDGYELSEGVAICVELVGSRFLRRMVRLLVQASMSLVAEHWCCREKNAANSIQDATESSTSSQEMDAEALLNLVVSRDRSLVSGTAPPYGLLFVGARLMDTCHMTPVSRVPEIVEL